MDKLWINPKTKKKRNKRKNLKEYLLNNINKKHAHTHTKKQPTNNQFFFIDNLPKILNDNFRHKKIGGKSLLPPPFKHNLSHNRYSED